MPTVRNTRSRDHQFVSLDEGRWRRLRRRPLLPLARASRHHRRHCCTSESPTTSERNRGARATSRQPLQSTATSARSRTHQGSAAATAIAGRSESRRASSRSTREIAAARALAAARFSSSTNNERRRGGSFRSLDVGDERGGGDDGDGDRCSGATTMTATSRRQRQPMIQKNGHRSSFLPHPLKQTTILNTQLSHLSRPAHQSPLSVDIVQHKSSQVSNGGV